MKSLFRPRRTVSALAAVSITTLGAAALAQNGTAVAAAAAAMQPAITIDNYAFKPGTLTVKAGTTVTWINKDEDVHTVKATDGPETFISQALEGGSRFGFTFHHAGTYHYICTVHPYMHGVVVVR